MRFFLEMQAKHEAALQKHDERLDRIERLVESNSKQIEANTTRIAQLVDVCLSLAHVVEDGFKEIRQIQAASEHKLNALIETVDKSEYKLNALIDTVDKLVRRNGAASPS